MRESLKIRRKLAKTNPQTYLPSVANTLNSLGVLQDHINAHELAETSFKEALSICKELAKLNPQTYLPHVAKMLNQLGIIQLYIISYGPAEASFQEALSICRPLKIVNPQKDLPFTAMTLNNLAKLYQVVKPNKKKSITYVQEAISILLPFSNLPYVQDYLHESRKILKDWGLDPETYIPTENPNP